jgi:hypothetical protein
MVSSNRPQDRKEGGPQPRVQPVDDLPQDFLAHVPVQVTILQPYLQVFKDSFHEPIVLFERHCHATD